MLAIYGSKHELSLDELQHSGVCSLLLRAQIWLSLMSFWQNLALFTRSKRRLRDARNRDVLLLSLVY